MIWRWLLAIVSVAALLGSVAAASIPVYIDSTDAGGSDISCGTVFNSDVKAARMQDLEVVLATGSDPGNVAKCSSELEERKAWAIPLAIVGAIVLIGALAMRAPTRRHASSPPI